MIGAVMYATTFAMKSLPNIHLLALFIVSTTRVYRSRALIPIYIYVILEGVYEGFSLLSWPPNLYMWLFMWGAVMLLPRELPPKAEPFIYCAVGGLHGLVYGTLWAPYNSLVMGFDMHKTLMWIAAGIPFDIAHCVGNTVSCILAVPLIRTMRRLEGKRPI